MATITILQLAKVTFPKEGDIAEVSRVGESYTTYTDLFKYLDFLNPDKKKDVFTKGMLVQVTKVFRHPEEPRLLLAACITQEGEEGVIGVKGLQAPTKFQVKGRTFSRPEGWLCGHAVEATKESLKVGCQDIDKDNLATLILELIKLRYFSHPVLVEIDEAIQAQAGSI